MNRILVNATTINVGGGVQAAVSFIEHVFETKPEQVEFNYVLSKQVCDALRSSISQDSRISVFESSPAGLRYRQAAADKLAMLETQFRPDLVYSIGFPSYFRFKAPEVGRYTNGWEICRFPAAWSHMSARERVMRKLKSYYRLRWSRYARYFETQTDIAKRGIVERLGVPPEHVLVLPNSVNPRFIAASETTCSTDRTVGRIFCFSAAHRHKNLTIIPSVARLLQDQFNFQATFVLTVDETSDIWAAIVASAEKLSVRKRIENLGPIGLDKAVTQYAIAQCVFLPSLAEIFSATYLEAMAMRAPIVTPDLDFARAICGDAAAYYNPLSPHDAAQTIFSVLSNENLQSALTERGTNQLKTFPDPATKHDRLISWLSSLATKERLRAYSTGR